jgi:hypothetical protein
MTKPPNDTSEEMFDPKKMESIVERLKREGRMPTLERINEVMQEARAKYLQRLKELGLEE